MTETMMSAYWRRVGQNFMELVDDYDHAIREMDRVRGSRDELAALVDELRQDCNQLQKERDEVKREKARLHLDHLRDLGDAYGVRADMIPRVIQPDDLREGQVVAAYCDEGWHKADVYRRLGGSGHMMESYALLMNEDAPDTIVLLADTPEPEPDPDADTMYIDVVPDMSAWKCTGYADDDHQDAEITQWHDETRLTVHDLNVAPVGSVLIASRNVAIKRLPYTWSIAGVAAGDSAETLIALGWDTARLETGGGDE